MTRQTNVPVRQDPRPKREEMPAPRRHIDSLRTEIERLFDAFEPARWMDFPFARLPQADDGLSPAMDLSENGKAYALRIEIPGIDPARIEVKLSNGSLSISGEKSSEAQEQGDDFHISERSWGSFRRTVRLPEDVDRDAIEASCSNGVLTVILPKSAKALAAERKIDVKAA